MSKYIVSPNEDIDLSSSFIDFFSDNLKTDLTFLKVYIYFQIKSAKGEDEFDLKIVADELFLTENEVWQALNFWEKEGKMLFKELVVKEVTVENKNLKLLAQIVSKMLAKPLTHRDLYVLYSLHDDLKLEIETIFLLIEYCIELKKINISYIEKVGEDWAERGLLKFEDAKEYLDKIRKKQREKHHYKELLNLPKMPSEAEYAHIRIWKDELKLSDEIIKDAFKKTLRAIGSPSFSYANAILVSWKDENLHTDTKNNKNALNKGKTKNKFNDYKQTRGRYNYSEIEKRQLEKLQKKGESK